MSNEQEDNKNTDQMSADKKQAIQVFKQYGSKFATVIVIVLGGYFGWNYFQQQNITTGDTEAADAYTNILDLQQQIAVKQGIPDTAKTDTAKKDKQALVKQQQKLQAQVDSLVAKHGDDVYAWQSLIGQASSSMNNNDTKSAVKFLQSAMNIQPEDAGLQAITQLRYAQALLANNQGKEAKNIANKQITPSFEPSKQELLGDIFLVEKDEKSAIAAYQKAWNILAKRKENRDILRLKMESLGIEITPIETKKLFEEKPVATPNIELPADQVTTSQGDDADKAISAQAPTAQGSDAQEAKVTEAPSSTQPPTDQSLPTSE